ncbi:MULTISPECIES: 2-dehydropantoate 2-reductase [Mesorhizobium]|uniref:2-dehydropantoate 2-reductase n=2 Tax=Phyllobacteriaceae TaxID=69277 RepID=UPI000FCB4545|nr:MULTISPECIES: 2-dehydropantoate 2-reductase [Mesorhizobium]MCF6124617.1 2-dehydropantoate 2-reductase [Mesorhizobium ciceri]MCQ8814295.1 2-dehydropantoate 2-reductase [Mesorhizobium sp. SEMIA396]RUU83078.1 2-dehydropantoate 2-reductase [Mesorhizobium sp. M7A.F.Ca.MR.362.00.0.0]RUX74417.1 2-dehydropantoate 2-reductase [Mesorhizobium sp. M7A.F.Ca.CA.004.08.2.1]RUX83362.1 2-dehydropantoate 2-reductase [Mesorhizobium sp. M7A.F.Ca.CA.004.08.1.1]
MKITIFGAGAIGGYLAAKLAITGRTDLSIVARGAHLEAIKADGLRLIEDGQEISVPVRAAAKADELGAQDYVVLALKAHSLSPALDQIAPLLGDHTSVVTMQNGVPWWYFHGVGGPLEGTRLNAVDPGGAIWQRIGPDRVIGSVVYPAVEVDAPGLIRHVEGKRFSLGEPSGERSERVTLLAEEMVKAGLQAPVREDIRSEIWVKLWGNLSFNPISALTGSTLAAIVADDGTRALARTMMLEAQAIGESLGVRFPIAVDRRIKGAGDVGEHKTSMLQDLERGRPMEIDALVSAVQELGRLTDKPTPTIDAVLALVRRLAVERGCYR